MVIMFFCWSILFTVYAQEKNLGLNKPENWEEISGKVENLNFDTLMIIIKAYSGDGQSSYQEVPILIMKEAKIVKNNQAFVLKDLKTGDEILARYIVTPSGQKAAYYLWVK